MKLLQKALFLDAQKLPVKASLEYEELLKIGQANLDSYINLAVLYFVCIDFGYETANNLPEDFIMKAWNRVFKILEEAKVKFGYLEEITFWDIYFHFILRGEEPMYEKCALLAEKGEILIPYFHLYTAPRGEKYRQYAEKLFDAVKDEKTEKNRYVKSLLESTMKQRDFGKKKLGKCD